MLEILIMTLRILDFSLYFPAKNENNDRDNNCDNDDADSSNKK